MIVSSSRGALNIQFEELLTTSQVRLEAKNKTDPTYFSKRSPTEFEMDVRDAMCEASKGTPFEGTLRLVSGHSFPDIVINDFYGVEVKTARTNWKSTGNSVLESTRVDKIERIYLLFCRQSKPAAFKFRKYEECLYEVAVTHSPRYLIDMDLAVGKNIFDKMKVSYATLRTLDKPIKPFVDYYRLKAKPGEEPWWMEGADTEEAIVKPTVSLWNSLSSKEQVELRNQAMALFPEVFGKSTTKYRNLALWLATRKGVINAALRDPFSAGGRKTIVVNGKRYTNVPKVFFHLDKNLDKVIRLVKKLDPDEAKHFWGVKGALTRADLLSVWLDLVVKHAARNRDCEKKFIVHLLGVHIGLKRSSTELRKLMAEHGLKYRG